jgi:type II secretory pathway component PulF
MSWDFRDGVIWLLFFMAPMTVAVSIAYLCLTAPARRNERARLFLDLLETALKTGQSPERTITAISETRDRSVTVHFHFLAALIEEGARLEQALLLTPRLLPRAIGEVVRIGARENALERLLPAARAMLGDMNSRVRGALNYVLVFAVVVVPGVFFFLPFLSVFVWPKLKAVLEDMGVAPPTFTMLVFENYEIAATIQFSFLAILIVLAVYYVVGPRIVAWTRVIFGGIPDWFTMALPWKRYRLHRDFTAVLAILLDAGMQEAHAVHLAAEATASDVFIHRAKIVAERLRNGDPLPEALKAIERSREFQWRWTTALRGGKDFFAALRAWHETLETRAFQQEQAAAHVITTSIVLLNGVIVGVIASAVFLIIISLIEEGSLW